MTGDPAAHLLAIGTATPDHDVHDQFVRWAQDQVAPGSRRLFDRMAARSAIAHRWSVIPPGADGGPSIGPGGFYGGAVLPGTAARMAAYSAAAPALAMRAVAALADKPGGSLAGVTHLIVASCTGFVAPGIDQILAHRLELPPSTERLLVGFMGCYAAVTALRSAYHIVRSVPGARVLVVTVELSTLHMQATPEPESLLAQLQFGDGAAAAIVAAEPAGLRIGRPFAAALPDSADLIRWTITDGGFVMDLSGAVPRRIAAALADPALVDTVTGGAGPDAIDGWAVHAGGRSILDAVETAMALPPHALDASRAVLRDKGNMSSATLMFVLEAMLAGPRVANGVALAFGPGLAAEGLGFAHA